MGHNHGTGVRPTMARLTAREVATAKPMERTRMIADGAGLYLRVSRTGGKSWIVRYQKDGKVHDLGLGSVRNVTLAQARALAAERRRDPLATIKTFAQVAEAFILAQEPGWSASNTEEWRQTLAKHVYPVFGNMHVAAVDTLVIRRALDPLWSRRPDAARRLLDRIRRVLDAAAAAGYRDPNIANPARWEGHLKLLMPARAKTEKDRRH